MERRQMVRVVVDEMRRYDQNPTRLQCLTVVRNITRQYPKSFADMAPNGSLLGGDYSSLLIQVKNRIENLNRPASCMRHRSSRSSSTNKRRPSDIYGCTRFQTDLPTEETDETVEQKRPRLVDIYSQEGAAGALRAEVKNLMGLTFCLQRHHINALPPPDVEDMRSKWPFLFIPKFIYAHFELLTDISVLRTLELSMEECGRTITQYFTRKPTNNDVKNVLSKGEDDEMALRGTGPTFLTGLAAVFAVYYVFNLQYQDEAACTLEFIQRRFIGVNPERGSKATRGKGLSKMTGSIVQKKHCTVNGNVSTLLKNLIDFQWDFI
ncbi:hypothetical protein IRJ41_019963 [Triplophysa rosa]|uniref:Uncharacterized protein n=1 Tax=Triplophysa rosa TaxID=992332 RepID=A0A9W7W9V3_TRIRA|nr:hypothetical protein IRJ41_019963 [Triplophysa rosa]